MEIRDTVLQSITVKHDADRTLIARSGVLCSSRGITHSRRRRVVMLASSEDSRPSLLLATQRHYLRKKTREIIGYGRKKEREREREGGREREITYRRARCTRQRSRSYTIPRARDLLRKTFSYSILNCAYSLIPSRRVPTSYFFTDLAILPPCGSPLGHLGTFARGDAQFRDAITITSSLK